MATGIAQKNCIALFPLLFLRKNDKSIMKRKNIKRKHGKHWKEFWYLNREKVKNKKHTYPDYALHAILKAALFQI